MGQFSYIFAGLVSPLEFVLHHPGFTVSATIPQIHHCSLDKRHRYQKEIQLSVIIMQRFTFVIVVSVQERRNCFCRTDIDHYMELHLRRHE